MAREAWRVLRSDTPGNRPIASDHDGELWVNRPDGIIGSSSFGLGNIEFQGAHFHGEFDELKDKGDFYFRTLNSSIFYQEIYGGWRRNTAFLFEGYVERKFQGHGLFVINFRMKNNFTTPEPGATIFWDWYETPPVLYFNLWGHRMDSEKGWQPLFDYQRGAPIEDHAQGYYSPNDYRYHELGSTIRRGYSRYNSYPLWGQIAARHTMVTMRPHWDQYYPNSTPYSHVARDYPPMYQPRSTFHTLLVPLTPTTQYLWLGVSMSGGYDKGQDYSGSYNYPLAQDCRVRNVQILELQR